MYSCYHVISNRLNLRELWLSFRQSPQWQAPIPKYIERRYGLGCRLHNTAANSHRIDGNLELHSSSASSFPSFDTAQADGKSAKGGQINDDPFESRLEGGRAQYIDRIARHLPADSGDDLRSLAEKGRHSRHLRWRASKMSSSQDQEGHENPFLNWQTALAMLKRHYVHQAHTGKNAASGMVRRVDSRESKNSFKQVMSPPGRPEIWTEAVLTAYIQDLLDFRPPRPDLLKVLPRERKDRTLASVYDIADAVEAILHDQSLRPYMNIDAFNIALQFFYDNSMMTRARRIYLRMEDLCLDLSNSTWNIMLRACASQKNLHDFTYLLEQMILRGLKPDVTTWITFIMVLRSVEAKKMVIEIMRRIGIMNSSWIGQEVANEMMQYEYCKHIAEDSGVTAFFTKMSQMYGQSWLSTSSGNTMLSCIMKTSEAQPDKAVIQALRLLYEMKQYTFEANSLTMRLLLKRCMRAGSQDLPIEVLSLFGAHWGLKPDGLAHQILFELAWSHKRLNMSRVIWISACLNGFATFRMRMAVRRSLLKEKNSVDAHEPRSVRSVTQMLGQFLIGVDHLSERRLGPDWKAEKWDRLTTNYVLAAESHTATAGQGRLWGGLVLQLRRALELDKEWASLDFWSNPRQQVDLVKNSLQIHIVRSTQTKGIRDYGKQRSSFSHLVGKGTHRGTQKE